MFKFIKLLIAGIAVSCYFFPFEFTFLPGVNTKMAMAGVGLVLYAIDIVRGNAQRISTEGLAIVFVSAFVSLCGFLSAVINNTNDYTYATYIVSMFVWLGGAYTAIKIVRWFHGYVSVELIGNYLIGVCVGQCVLALIINSSPSFKSIVDSIVVGFDFVDTSTMTEANRLYGIGAALDVAGTRFAAVLVIIAVLLQRSSESRYKKYIWLYLVSFVLITVVGNMVARTTIVGVVVSIIYWITTSGLLWMYLRKNSMRIWVSLLILLSVLLPLLVYLYSTNDQFYSNIRFAFEGFFSLAETGHWETNSNNILRNMIIFPDNLMTWIIGDGYLSNPTMSDPYYVGPTYVGFYKDTDIGYIRFIFYFGLIGLSSFIYYFYKVAKTCVTSFPKYATMFWLILAINMIIWLKVSTDIFLVFAIFLCVSKEENDAYEKQYEDSLPDPLDV